MLKPQGLFSNTVIPPFKKQKALATIDTDVVKEIVRDVLEHGIIDKTAINNWDFKLESHVTTQDNSTLEENECLSDSETGFEMDDNDSYYEDDEEASDKNPAINTELLSSFEAYVAESEKNRYRFTPDMEAAISLFRMLSEKRIPLNVYDDIFKWHTQYLGATKFVPRSTLLSNLSSRYNMDGCKPYIEKVELPYSKARIELVCHDMGQQILSLLTDPRISDEDYLFFDDNPFAPPPPEFQVLGDINTGQCYRKTYNELIRDPGKEVLLPIIFYMDSAVTGTDSNLPIEALQFTLGIFDSHTRDKAYAWRDIGFIKNYLVEETQAVDNILASNHMDASNYVDVSESDTEDSCGHDTAHTGNENKYLDTKAQDLHVMLDVLLKSYHKVQNSGGIEWNLCVKGNMYSVTFKPFIMFVKGDSVEHDKHCGHYTSKTQGVQSLCRYCTCKTEDIDDAYRDDGKKWPGMIKKLIDQNDTERLQALSQQRIFNAWYPCKFGSHNKLGIHGACPMEILHWLQLGKFKYDREMFVNQTGADTILSNRFNGLAKSMGLFFKRQSDRDLPRLVFSRGIQKGKLTAQEMTGLLLVLLATIRCVAGTDCLLRQCRGEQKKYFGNPTYIQDWVLMLETHLQWEAWLSQPGIPVYEIRRSKTKVRELMEMEKRIGKREKGMAFKTMNFHACLHIAEDMLNFGVPNNVNTRSNEQHHKKSKTAAQRMQKRGDTFDIQCARQIHDMNVIDLAYEEMNGNAVWDYYNRQCDDEDEEEETSGDTSGDTMPVSHVVEHKITGVRTTLFFDESFSRYRYTVHSKMASKEQFHYPMEILAFLAAIIENLGNGIREVNLYTEHNRHGQIFRASPLHLGKPWRDWVYITWGKNCTLPAQLHCFVDFRNIPRNKAYEKGVYAVIESADLDESDNDEITSQLLLPYRKETEEDEEGIPKRKFYLVDVESFDAPACVVPNLGHEDPTAFLCLLPRKKWADQFRGWLNLPHTHDFKED